jgi:hypothetical protein
MSSIIVAGDVSGSVSLTAPSAAGSTVITLPATSGTMALAGGAVSGTTGTFSGALSATTGTFTDEVTMPVLGVNTTAASTGTRFIINGDNAYDAGMTITAGGTAIANIGSYAQFISGSASNLVIKGYGPSYTAVITSTGGVALNSGATSWSALSDERYKDIIEPITNGVVKVNSLRAVIGKYKTDEEGKRRSFLIAQDVQAVLPEAVTEYTEEDGKLSLSYTDVIPLLVSAIQEQQALIENLTTRLAALENK